LLIANRHSLFTLEMSFKSLIIKVILMIAA